MRNGKNGRMNEFEEKEKRMKENGEREKKSAVIAILSFTFRQRRVCASLLFIIFT